ncbi:hypothetical protein QFZ87_000808 [Bacillus sp. SLBN-46]|nr:hypothetical protein [Bacillus sp. SLBN-46]
MSIFNYAYIQGVLTYRDDILLINRPISIE